MAGIDFKAFNERGIDIDDFGEVFTTSGLVLNDNIKWVTFHGSYDFAYLVKVLSNQVLPEDDTPFNDLLSIYFPTFYDVRQMTRNTSWLKGSLNRIATDLDVRRIGHSHQAGSDSLVTSKVFFKLVQSYNDHIDLASDKNKLFGFTYKMYDEYDYNYNGFNNYGQMQNFLHMPNGIGMSNNISGFNNVPVGNSTNNKVSSTKNTLPNMMYYPNNGFNNYPNNNMNVNPVMFNNYNNNMNPNSNSNNYNMIYPPQQNFDMANNGNNFYGGYYPNSLKQGSNKDSKFNSQ